VPAEIVEKFPSMRLLYERPKRPGPLGAGEEVGEMVRQIVGLDDVIAGRDPLCRADLHEMQVGGAPTFRFVRREVRVASDQRRDLGLQLLLPLKEADELQRLGTAVHESIVSTVIGLDPIPVFCTPQRRMNSARADGCNYELAHNRFPPLGRCLRSNRLCFSLASPR